MTIQPISQPGKPSSGIGRLDAHRIHARAAAWHNEHTGQGVRGIDKTRSHTFGGVSQLDHDHAFDLYRGDMMARRIIKLPVNEALRQGWELRGLEPEQAQAVMAAGASMRCGHRLQDVGVGLALKLWLAWGDVCGGSAIILQCDDGLDKDQPLNEANPYLVKLKVVTRRDLKPDPPDPDIKSPTYGEVTHWTYCAPGGMSIRLHQSRLLIYGGDAVPMGLSQAPADGWGIGKLAPLQQEIADFWADERAIHTIIAQWEVWVQKIKGLYEAFEGDGGEGVSARMALDHLMMSMHRRILLDADDEDVVRLGASVAGLGDLLDRAAGRLAAKLGWPVTLLMGQAPSGLSTDDKSGRANFLDSVKAEYQGSAQAPGPALLALRRIYGLMMRSADGPTGGVEPEGWRVDFNPLHQEDPGQVISRKQALVSLMRDAVEAGLVLPVEAVATLAAADVFEKNEEARTEAAEQAATGLSDLDILQQGRLGLEALHTGATAQRFAALLGVQPPTPQQIAEYWANTKGGAPTTNPDQPDSV